MTGSPFEFPVVAISSASMLLAAPRRQSRILLVLVQDQYGYRSIRTRLKIIGFIWLRGISLVSRNLLTFGLTTGGG